MIEQTLYDFLSSAMPVKVYTEIPVKPAKEYILIEKTGGGESGHIETALVALQSVSVNGSLLRAMELNKELIEVMTSDDGFGLLPEIISVSRNSDYNFTDKETKSYRYQAVFNIAYYAE